VAGHRHPCSDRHRHVSQCDGTSFVGTRETTASALIFGNEAGSSELVPGMDKSRLLTPDSSADGRKVWICPQPGDQAPTESWAAHTDLGK